MPATECPECDGTGALVAAPDRFSRVYEPCPLCGGSGVLDNEGEPDA